MKPSTLIIVAVAAVGVLFLARRTVVPTTSTAALPQTRPLSGQDALYSQAIQAGTVVAGKLIDWFSSASESDSAGSDGGWIV